ncbi:MAG: hypothetical protein PHH36_09010 [Sideroxydans sp.]|nr:hypothetical protein [Sideroxydans sp.]
MRRLAPFISFSLLLHLALLSGLNQLSKKNITSPTTHRPLTVRLASHPAMERSLLPQTTPSATRKNPAKRRTTPTAPITKSSPTDRTQNIPLDQTARQLLDSAIDIAREDAKIIEQQRATEEQKKRTTPIASLEQYLLQPHQEIRLSNGTLKIVTDAGAVCFQPVPVFARDTPNLYGIPTSCP